MTIRKSVTLAAILVTLTVAAALILVAQAGNLRIEQRLTQEAASGRSLVWNQSLERLFEHMNTGMVDFERDFALRQALKSGDAQAARQAVESLINLVSEQGYFDQLIVLKLDGERLYGDEASAVSSHVQALVTAAAADDRPKHGLGLDAQGEPVALLAFRLLVRHEPIGTVVFQRSLGTVLERFKAIQGAEVYLVGAEGSLFAGTRPDLFEQLGLSWPALGRIDRQTRSIDTATYTATLLPLPGVDGQPLAHLVSVADATAVHLEQRRFEFIAYTGVALLLILASLGLFYYMRHALRPLHTAVVTVSALAEGDLNVSFETGRQDEVGTLMRALQSMAERLRHIIGTCMWPAAICMTRRAAWCVWPSTARFNSTARRPRPVMWITRSRIWPMRHSRSPTTPAAPSTPPATPAGASSTAVRFSIKRRKSSKPWRMKSIRPPRWC